MGLVPVTFLTVLPFTQLIVVFELLAPEPEVAGAVVAVVVVAVVVELCVKHDAHAMPATFKASPGLSALLPSPSACAVSTVANDAIDESPVVEVARRISLALPVDLCTYVATEPSAICKPAGTPPRLFETTALNA